MRVVLIVSLAIMAAPAAAVAQAPAAVPADPIIDPDDRVRCRQIAITGSLVKKEKVCKTVGEWRRLADRGNDVVRDQADTMRICSGGDVICSGN